MYAQSKRLMMDDFELLSAYIDGEVNDEERARIESDPRLMNELDQILAISKKSWRSHTQRPRNESKPYQNSLE